MSTTTAQKHVLAVDDNPGDVGLLRQVMDGIPGVALHTASNVRQAQAFLTRLPPHGSAPVPDLILLDLRMPILPGHNVIPVVRREPSLQHIKIVVFSSSALERDRAECESLGADDYIIKPCDWVHWRSAITQILMRHRIIGDDAQPDPRSMR